LNPSFDAVQVEAEKPNVHKNASSMDPENNAYEQAHYTSFRDHFLGQPVSGIRDNVYSITSDQIKEFHHKYYVGENIVVSGAGNINPQAFNEVVSTHFGNTRAKVDGTIDNEEQPFHTPSLMFQRDDELPNTTVSVSFVAPGWNDPDFYAMQYFAKLIGEFRVDKHTGAHLNTPHLQYNSFHTDLGNYADVVLHKPFYFPYSDTGLFGNFLFGNEIFNRHMLLMSQGKLTEYAQNVSFPLFRSTKPRSSELATASGTTS
jgi:processing peptidase subunit beta